MNLEEYFEEVCEIFGDKFFDEDDFPIVSRISHDLSDKARLEGHEHNCIGCNLSKSVGEIYFFLQTVPHQMGIEYPHKIYFYLKYLLVEQIQFIYSLFERKGYLRNNDVFYSKYPTFMKLKRWTNFFKHPKYFMLVHHPEFTYERHPDHQKLIETTEEATIIDDNFVKKFYRGEGNRERLSREIANKDNVIVIFPDLKRLAINFHKELERFINNVIEDDDYMRIINEDATFEYYFELDEEE